MFDKRKIKTKAGIICLVIIGMAFFSIIRQAELKKEYGISYDVVDMDEYMIFDGYQITIEKASVWDSDDYLNYLGADYTSYANWFDFYHDGVKLKVAVVELEINVLKVEENDKDCGLGDFRLIFENAYTGYDPFLTEDINKCSNKFDMSVGEAKTYTVPYTIVENQLSKEQWNNIDKLNFRYVREIYPVERGININVVTSYINNYEQVKYDDVFVIEENTEAESTTALNSDESVQTKDGMGKIYAQGEETITAGDFEISLKNVEFIYDIEDMYEVIDDDGYNLMVDNYIDNATGELYEECFMTATYEIKNITDDIKTHNIMMNKLGNNTSEFFSEVIYSSEYNKDGNQHDMLQLQIEPGETVSITTIMVTDIDNFDSTKFYYEIDYLGGDNTGFFIEWDMTKQGGVGRD